MTSEKKADWWELTSSDNIIRPRKELVQEMYEATKQLFYVYTSNSFAEYAQQILGFKSSQTITKAELAEDIKSAEQSRAEEAKSNQEKADYPQYHNLISNLSVINKNLEQIRQLAQSTFSRWNNAPESEKRNLRGFTRDTLRDLRTSYSTQAQALRGFSSIFNTLQDKDMQDALKSHYMVTITLLDDVADQVSGYHYTVGGWTPELK